MKEEMFSGKFPVVAAGLLMACNMTDELRFLTYLEKEEKYLDLRWRFVYRKDIQGARIDLSQEGDATIIVCTNFYLDVHMGSTNPLLVYKGKANDYYLRFFVSGLGNVSRKVECSVYEIATEKNNEKERKE